ncbi:xanthine dehydrogenase family protein subunit M [Phaeobacter gallaeciensis]|uniref:Xanthine dehydrogenase family protein subunit M n=2 Tax=Roseobacteraceae TaxID=2854170 RepID=A0A366WZI7_9RHOB|nr:MULTISPECIES: xanthine dehydrogenase family protein subunit M [Roseobacteraceae]MBT3141029.1 xanthine dehydrogenase family protein subunit M [Falsiruegeria litorea]MBT8168081.1 xanthine dehydrogenase family protein subunit M [Falsiruegeria litorea]RBW56126.1 xanthine dehydrogenase family protein subunit M [Phaeobacter gallaeciensis]
MIPAAFEYYRPKDMAGVLAVLEEHGDDARVMAGGHSLIPMMKLRMADVPHLIDLQDVGGMSDIEVGTDMIRLGALVTQADIIDHTELSKAAPILREAALQIADPQVRYMGTVGGNVANGDPGNDMPGLMQCLNAAFTVVGPNGERDIPACAFYEAAYVTARGDEEVLTHVAIPTPNGGYAYEKQKRKIGDYATAAAAVQIVKDGGICVSASIAMTNLSDTPVYSEAAGEALLGTSVDTAALDASVAAMLGDIEPTEDNRGPVAFKNHVAGVILRRAILTAWSRA